MSTPDESTAPDEGTAPPADASKWTVGQLFNKLTMSQLWAVGGSLIALVVGGFVVGEKYSVASHNDAPKSLIPVIPRTMRGASLLDAAESVGLVDVENRDDETAALPPDKFFSLAQSQVAISGISLLRTFDQKRELIKTCLDNSKAVYVILIHPDSIAVRELRERNKEDVRSEIMQSIDNMKQTGLIAYPGFHVRFTDDIPPFTGVLIDGDIEPIGQNPNDKNGQIRIQTGTKFQTQHKGLVLQLKNSSELKKGACFEYFASDMRQQWRSAKSDPRLLPPVNNP